MVTQPGPERIVDRLRDREGEQARKNDAPRAGEPVEENHTCWGLTVSAQVLWDLRQAGFRVGGETLTRFPYDLTP